MPDKCLIKELTYFSGEWNKLYQDGRVLEPHE